MHHGVELQRSHWWCQRCYFISKGWPLDGSGWQVEPPPCAVDPCRCKICDPARYRRLMDRTREWRTVARDIQLAQEGTRRDTLFRGTEQRDYAAGLLQVLTAEPAAAPQAAKIAERPLLDAVTASKSLPDPAEARCIRERAGLTRREMAAHVGVSATTIMRYEDGASPLRGVYNRARYCDVLQALDREAVAD